MFLNLPKWLPGYGHVIAIRIRDMPRPLWIRLGTSDIRVMRQVFSQCEYDGVVESLRDAPLILDLGASIGCSAFWFLAVRPDARVICVEPDPVQIELCRKNLSDFRQPPRLVTGAVWSSTVPLRVVKGERGHEWRTHVRPAVEGEPGDLVGISIDDLLADDPSSPIDLVKMDIEGGETDVLPAGVATWLRRTRNLVIEWHGPEAKAALDKALSAFTYSDMHLQGELTVITDIAPLPCE